MLLCRYCAVFNSSGQAVRYTVSPMSSSADCLHGSLGAHADKSPTQSSTVAWAVLSGDPIAFPVIQGPGMFHLQNSFGHWRLWRPDWPG